MSSSRPERRAEAPGGPARRAPTEMPAWSKADRVLATATTLNERRNLNRFIQSAPLEYAQLAEIGAERCRKHFDPAALWMWSVAVEASRRGEALSQAELIRRSGFTKSSGRRLLSNLNHAGFLFVLGTPDTGPKTLVVHMPSLTCAKWRLAQHHAKECLGEAAETYLTELSGSDIEIMDGLEAEERRAAAEKEARDLEALQGGRIGSRGGRENSHSGNRARPLGTQSSGTRVEEGERKEENQRAVGLTEDFAAEGRTGDLQEKYFPSSCPLWADPQWFKNLIRRVGRAEALSAVGQVNFLLDQGGENAPRSPKGLASWLGAHYANKHGNTDGVTERLRHEARRREVLQSQRKEDERVQLNEAAEVLVGMGFEDLAHPEEGISEEGISEEVE